MECNFELNSLFYEDEELPTLLFGFLYMKTIFIFAVFFSIKPIFERNLLKTHKLTFSVFI